MGKKWAVKHLMNQVSLLQIPLIHFDPKTFTVVYRCLPLMPSKG
jgi:hypothetical protein